jgi:hypothetical protein
MQKALLAALLLLVVLVATLQIRGIRRHFQDTFSKVGACWKAAYVMGLLIFKEAKHGKTDKGTVRFGNNYLLKGSPSIPSFANLCRLLLTSSGGLICHNFGCPRACVPRWCSFMHQRMQWVARCLRPKLKASNVKEEIRCHTALYRWLLAGLLPPRPHYKEATCN